MRRDESALARRLAVVCDGGRRGTARRDAAGHMARVEGGSLVESHAPLAAVFEAFPAAAAMEEAMISKALGVPVTRIAETSGDHCQIRFEAFRCGAGAA